MTLDVAKMVRVTDDALLADLEKRVEPRLRRRFLEIVGWLRARHTLKEITGAIRDGRLWDMIAADVAKAGAAYASSVNTVYVAVGVDLAEALSEGLDQLIVLDPANPRATRALAETTMRIARDFSQDTRDVVGEILRDGLNQGVSPRISARRFRDSIGLTAHQVRHVENYRGYLETLDRKALERELRDARHDRTVERAIRDGKPMTRAQIDGMVEKYRKNYLAFRAETVARDETLGALNRGADDGWWQAIDSGAIAHADVEGTWLVRIDGRERDSHHAMRGQKRPLGEPFVTGEGFSIRYPHDPDAPLSETAQCRCRRVVRYRRSVEESARAAA